MTRTQSCSQPVKRWSAPGDEHRVPLAEVGRRPLDVQRASSFQDDVHLVVSMRLLAVRLRRQNVDADLEPGRLMNELVAASAPSAVGA